jgi:hypothetical protein
MTRVEELDVQGQAETVTFNGQLLTIRLTIRSFLE